MGWGEGKTLIHKMWIKRCFFNPFLSEVKWVHTASSFYWCTQVNVDLPSQDFIKSNILLNVHCTVFHFQSLAISCPVNIKFWILKRSLWIYFTWFINEIKFKSLGDNCSFEYNKTFSVFMCCLDFLPKYNSTGRYANVCKFKHIK